MTTTEQSTTPDLDDLRQELEAGPLSATTVRWLHAGITAYLAGEARNLEHALGLAGHGKPSPLTRHRRRVRDDALRAAYAEISGASERERLETLAAACVHFEATTWPRWRWREGPHPAATPVEAALFEACDTGQPLPASRSRLAEIVADVGGHSSRPAAARA